MYIHNNLNLFYPITTKTKQQLHNSRSAQKLPFNMHTHFHLSLSWASRLCSLDRITSTSWNSSPPAPPPPSSTFPPASRLDSSSSRAASSGSYFHYYKRERETKSMIANCHCGIPMSNSLSLPLSQFLLVLRLPPFWPLPLHCTSFHWSKHKCMYM